MPKKRHASTSAALEAAAPLKPSGKPPRHVSTSAAQRPSVPMRRASDPSQPSSGLKRTTSGGALSHSTLFANHSSTPYVYMAAQEQSSSSSLLNAPADDDPSVFRRHCGGATIRLLHSSSTAAFSLPPGFDVVVVDGFLNATMGQRREPLFSVPLGSICRAQLLRAEGANAGLWTLLCGCCYGGRQKVLALDLDAPVGWIQYESLAGRGIAGPVRLGLFVLDAEDYLDAMGISLE